MFMPRYVALLRGINVGRAKAISMAQLASVFSALDFSDVATVLRSGNVVFSSDEVVPPDTPSRIEAAVLAATGVQSSALLLDSAGFSAILDASPLVDIATDGSKSFVTFVTSMPTSIELPDAASLAPEILAVGPAAVYQWMPDGSLQTRVPRSFWKQFAGPVTARNWNTVLKLRALLSD
jgi:uncharacterized protein (DUF1697 family)